MSLIKRFKARKDDYKQLFSGTIGQKVLNDLMIRHGVLKTSFRNDPVEMAFLEGRKAVILDILEMIETSESVFRKRIEKIENGSEYDSLN